MTRIEAITNSDIAEVEESTNVFEGVREATEPLCAFLSLISAEWLMGVFDAAPKEKPGEAAHQGPRCQACGIREGSCVRGRIRWQPRRPDCHCAWHGLGFADGAFETADLFPSEGPEQERCTHIPPSTRGTAASPTICSRKPVS